MFILSDSYWSIRTTDKKGRCTFAKKVIKPGIVVGDYLGKIIRPEEDNDANGIYGMSAHDTFIIDPPREDIGIHCVNHSCMANLGIYPYKGHILYVTLRTIFPKEELTVSYMVEPSTDSTDGSYLCCCQTPLCHGSMFVSQEKADAFWEGFIKKGMGTYYNQLPAQYGEQLLPLETYPSHFPDEDIFDIFGSLEKAPLEIPTHIGESISTIRSSIRSSGRRLINKTKKEVILGIYNGFIVSSPL